MTFSTNIRYRRLFVTNIPTSDNASLRKRSWYVDFDNHALPCSGLFSIWYLNGKNRVIGWIIQSKCNGLVYGFIFSTWGPVFKQWIKNLITVTSLKDIPSLKTWTFCPVFKSRLKSWTFSNQTTILIPNMVFRFFYNHFH